MGEAVGRGGGAEPKKTRRDSSGANFSSPTVGGRDGKCSEALGYIVLLEKHFIAGGMRFVLLWKGEFL